jgi:hypothetical protein
VPDIGRANRIVEVIDVAERRATSLGERDCGAPA